MFCGSCRRLRSLCHDVAPKVGTRLEELRREEDLAKARAAQIAELGKEFQSASKSEAMYFFESCLSSKNPLSAIAEMGHYLDAWKLPRVQPLLRRQRELLDELTDAPVVGRVHVPREPEETGGPKHQVGQGLGLLN